MRKAALYRRVSTAEQAETNYSLDTQRDILTAYAKQQGYEIVRDYVDPGYTGTTRDRPALTQMLGEAASRTFDAVLIYRLDRLARTPYVSYSIIHELTQAGVDLMSYTEPQVNTTTPMGKASLGILSTFAEMERDTFLQRSRDGTHKAVSQGYYPGGVVAYGYQLEDRKLIIHEQEAEVIRLIYGWAAERGWTTIRIAQELTTLGIPTRYRTTGKGFHGVPKATQWQGGAVYRLLTNPVYRGEYQYGRRGGSPAQPRTVTTHQVPPIVAEDQWYAVQEGLTRNKLTASRNSRRTYMLRSLIKCGTCGRTYVGTHNRGWTGYMCGGRAPRIGRENQRCKSPPIKAADLEPEIWDAITRMVLNPDAHLSSTPAPDYTVELAHVRKGLKQARAGRSRLTDLYLEGHLDKPDYLTRAATLDAQVATLEMQERTLTDETEQQRTRTRQIKELHTLAAQYHDDIHEADDATRQRLAHLCIRRITIQPDRSADVEWKF